MLGFKKIFVAFLSISTSLFSSWNDDYLNQSLVLAVEIKSLNNWYYLAALDELLFLKRYIDSNPKLLTKIRDMKGDWRENMPKRKEGFFLKKRPHNSLKDAIAWELSIIIGAPEFVVPSYPI